MTLTCFTSSNWNMGSAFSPVSSPHWCSRSQRVTMRISPFLSLTYLKQPDAVPHPLTWFFFYQCPASLSIFSHIHYNDKNWQQYATHHMQYNFQMKIFYEPDVKSRVVFEQSDTRTVCGLRWLNPCVQFIPCNSAFFNHVFHIPAPIINNMNAWKPVRLFNLVVVPKLPLCFCSWIILAQLGQMFASGCVRLWLNYCIIGQLLNLFTCVRAKARL